MTEANKYSYKYFKDWIFPKFHQIDLTDLLCEFEKGYNSSREHLDNTMGSGYLLKLQYIILPKLIRQNGHKLSNYLDDMWHVWMVATWESYKLKDIKQQHGGIWHYKIEQWEDIEEYGNSNAYIGEETPQSDVYSGPHVEYNRYDDLKRTSYVGGDLGIDINFSK